MAVEFICPSCTNVVALKNLNIGDEFECRYCKLRGVVPESGQPVTSFQVRDEPEENDSEFSKSSTDVTTTRTEKVRFQAVRALSGIIRVAAWILSLLAGIGGLFVFLEGDFSAGIVWIIGSFLILIMSLAIAEIMLVFLAIEENTRQRIK